MSEQNDTPGGQRYFYGALPVFLVDDVVAAAEYYRDILGFEVDFVYGNPAFYASVSRDDAIINFRQSQPAGRRNGMPAAGAGNGVDAFILVSQVDSLLDELTDRGAKIATPLQVQDYGMREFQIEDVNGYRLAFAEETDE